MGSSRRGHEPREWPFASPLGSLEAPSVGLNGRTGDGAQVRTEEAVDADSVSLQQRLPFCLCREVKAPEPRQLQSASAASG